VTPAGRDAVVGDGSGSGGGAAQEYVALAAAFAGRLAERDGDPGDDARAIGRAWGAGLAARRAADGADDLAGEGRVVDLLDRLGFSPDTVPGPGPGSSTTLLLRTCPLLEVARRHPDVVCQVHLGLVAGALEAQDESSEGLRLVPFARPGSCELVLPATLER
jgi:predicted ArsR family transcriptional regulator